VSEVVFWFVGRTEMSGFGATPTVPGEAGLDGVVAAETGSEAAYHARLPPYELHSGGTLAVLALR
jgi:hypothetical protein